MSFFVTVLQFFTASNRFDNPYDAITPELIEIADTNEMELSEAEAGYEPHMGRDMNGCTVGIEAFASPI